MKKLNTIYFATPMTGYTTPQLNDRFNQLHNALLDQGADPDYMRWYIPWRDIFQEDKSQPLETFYPDHPFANAKVICNRDRINIKNSDAVFFHVADLSDYPSRGVLCEVGWVGAYDKLSVMYRGEKKSHYHYPMIDDTITAITSSLDTAALCLVNLLALELR